VTADRDVREFQVVQQGERLLLRVVLRDGAPVGEAAGRLRERVTTRLTALGARDPDIEIATCSKLERPPGGKLEMVVADRNPRAGVAVG
jgi:phenylacetate-coenzyme A ligase PaaK-like adenylate-forming protein